MSPCHSGLTGQFVHTFILISAFFFYFNFILLLLSVHEHSETIQAETFNG